MLFALTALVWKAPAIDQHQGCLQKLGGRDMLNLLKTTSAVVFSLASLGFIAGNVALASISHVQEAGAVHVQEAEIQLLESAGLETVVIDGEVGHIL